MRSLDNLDITIALRYRPIIEFLKKRKLNKNSIIEIGSGSYGICPYLDEKTIITGVDIEFDNDHHPMLKPIKASAAKIPVKDKSFDVAVSMDMLEHLSLTERKKAVLEMLRIAKKCVIIGFPSGHFANKTDKFFNWYYTKTHGEDSNFLTEHLKYSLPEVSEILTWITESYKENKVNAGVKVINNTNIFLLLALLFMGFSQNRYLCRLFRYSIVCLSILRYFNFPPVYRQIIFINLKDNEQ